MPACQLLGTPDRELTTGALLPSKEEECGFSLMRATPFAKYYVVQLDGDAPIGDGVWRRYSQFRALHRHLSLEVAAPVVSRLQSLLPPKGLFHDLSPEFVRKRSQGLEAYLQAAVAIPEVQASLAWRDFLGGLGDAAAGEGARPGRDTTRGAIGNPRGSRPPVHGPLASVGEDLSLPGSPALGGSPASQHELPPPPRQLRGTVVVSKEVIRDRVAQVAHQIPAERLEVTDAEMRAALWLLERSPEGGGGWTPQHQDEHLGIWARYEAGLCSVRATGELPEVEP